MKIIKVKDYDAMTKELLKLLIKQIEEKPESVISFTTGETTRGLLLELGDAINSGLDISQSIFLNLDEYVGRKSSTYSVCNFMNEHLYDRIDNNPKEINMFNAEATDHKAEIERYEKILQKYPRDIQLLGLGTNGHIGANEPGTSFNSSSFVANSHDSTIRTTQELFNLSYEETPQQMFTMGFQEIMASKCVVLGASGVSKAKAVRGIVQEEIKTQLPASYLKNHSNFILLIDEAAASLLDT